MPPGISPDFYHAVKHNKLRRADWHDYCSPCFYLITLRKSDSPGIPLFSYLMKISDETIGVEFSPSGWSIYNALQQFAFEFPYIKLGRYVIMPDHLHMIMQVKQWTKIPLGSHIRRLKALCTICYQSKDPSFGDRSMFEVGFNDRILTKSNQLNIWNKYVEDNPHRLWLMRSYPDFFNRTYHFSACCLQSIWDQSISIESTVMEPHKFPVYGNSLLLRYPERIAVRFSSKFSTYEWEARQKEALVVAKNGGVLVSPAIHSEEKKVIKEGLLLGGKTIRIIPNGYLPREKPSGTDFYHCAEGRLLMFALNRPKDVKSEHHFSKDLCRRMNKCAEWIAQTEF